MTVKHKEVIKALIVYNKKKSNHKFIIDWTAKSGCTVICKIFFDYMDELKQALEHHVWIHNSRPRYYKKYGKVNNKLLFTDYYNNNQYTFFIDNRHEQSVFSIIRKIHGSILLKDETWFGNNSFGNQESLKYPFWATRKI